eukprot:2679131-Amphidinium_carterae.1
MRAGRGSDRIRSPALVRSLQTTIAWWSGCRRAGRGERRRLAATTGSLYFAEAWPISGTNTDSNFVGVGGGSGK